MKPKTLNQILDYLTQKYTYSEILNKEKIKELFDKLTELKLKEGGQLLISNSKKLIDLINNAV